MDGLTKEEILNKDNEEIIPYNSINHLITDWIDANNIRVPRITTKKFPKDLIGTLKVRLGVNRMNYKVPTGLYAIGNPNQSSKIIVSANYKLTFDTLRESLEGLNVWLLILDTKGINVWCAAGKGTFGSRELIYQLCKWDISKIVNHQEIILPQLGATSMEPHEVKKYTGFSISYGPVEACHLKDYIQNKEITEEMRTIKFNLKDRLVLTPIEAIHNSSIILIFFLLAQIFNYSFGLNLNTLIKPLVLSLIIGTFIFPVLLPYLPFKSFSLRSVFLIIPFLFYLNYFANIRLLENSLAFKLGYFLLISLFIIYQSFNFTGSTTFTSFSGVKREARYFKMFMIGVLIVAPLLMILGGVQ